MSGGRNMNKKVYISGAISTDRNHRSKFKAAQKRLEEKGYIVLNPVELIQKEKDKTWLEYLIDCLELIKRENPGSIYLLKNYMQSSGAQIERLTFKKLGKKIMSEREDA